MKKITTIKTKHTFKLVALATMMLTGFEQTHAQTDGWKLTGNTLNGTQKFGSLNSYPVTVITKNVERLRIDTLGKIGIGNPAPLFMLDVLSKATATTSYAAKIQGMGQTGVLRLQNTNAAGWSAADFFDNSSALKGGVGYGNTQTGGAFAGRTYLTSIGTNPLVLGTNSFARLYIDGITGNVGIGTTTPAKAGLVVDTKMSATNAIFGSNTSGISITSNFPGIGFNAVHDTTWKNLSPGFAGNLFLNPQTGNMEFQNTPNSQATGVKPWLATRMTITKEGRVGVGTSSPEVPLHVMGEPSGWQTPAILAVNNYSGPGIIASSLGHHGIVAETGGFQRYAGMFNGRVYAAGYYEASDERLKQNIRKVNNAMDIISQLQPKQYQFKTEGNYSFMHLENGDHYGLLAQDLEKLLPNLVKETTIDTRFSKHTKDEKNLSEDSINFKAVNYIELIPILIKAMQEQQEEINELKEALTGVKKETKEPVHLSNISLGQNIPNPVKGVSTIPYSIPAGCRAQLVITNSNGNTVKKIDLNGSGNAEINIETSRLSAGAYAYTLVVDGKKIDTKMMFVAK